MDGPVYLWHDRNWGNGQVWIDQGSERKVKWREDDPAKSSDAHTRFSAFLGNGYATWSI